MNFRKLALTIVLGLALSAHAQTPSERAKPFDPKGCASQPILERFEEFGRSGRMPPDLGRWLSDPQAQYVEPYQAFDNVHFVGVCWVSAWLIKTSAGPVLIDTLHEPFVDQLLKNIRAVGVDPADIRYVFMTHGHFDHVGGAYRIKELSKARFIMTQEGWDEGIESSTASQKSPRPWRFIDRDLVVKDGDQISVGDQMFRVYETPGHTYGTVSYSFSVQDGNQRWRAFTVGGLGLNAIESPRQVEAFISSIDRVQQLMESTDDPVQVHLTTHPFSNGLTEAKERLKNRAAGQEHPLVDPEGFRSQLKQLRAGAVDRLRVEKEKERKK